jgi:hypothetical protein
MKVKFLQSGGFAGLIRGCKIDSAELPDHEAKRLRALVKESGLMAGTPLSKDARDVFDYELELEMEGHRLSFTFDDRTLPAAARPLIGFLKACSGPVPLDF